MNKPLNILVFTVPSWNSKVGANSWATLLDGRDNAHVANICIRDEIPDSPVCSRYFQISENKILRSVLKRGTKTGREVAASAPCDESAEDLAAHNERYRRMTRRRRYSMLLARELAWKLGKWKTRELDEFLDSFKPDVILHSMEGYIHLNRIIAYAIKRTGAKAVGYIWDDNFTYKQSKRLGYKVYRFFQRGSLRRLAKRTDAFFAISEKTKREADAFFGIDCRLLTKPLNRVPEVEYGEIKAPISMLYTGNLLIGRDRSLLRVVNAVRAMPEHTFTIDVYTQTVLSDEMRGALEEGGVCRIHAPIPQAEVLEKQKQADVLLFLEDVDGPDAQVARLSFSTKTTDYLSAGRCIFAVGCTDTAPMEYFLSTGAALTAGNDAEIAEALSRMISDPRTLVRCAETARRVGLHNHEKGKIQATFDEVIAAVTEK